MPSKIEWTDETWNPTTGCTKVSTECKHCYAERLFPRVYGRDRKFTDVQLQPERLGRPLKWKKPRRVFVDSMSDLFHPDVPDSFIARVFATMYGAQWHTFQVLTKRPERAERLLNCRDVIDLWPLANVWLGTSVGMRDALPRIDHLRNTPAAVRFLSAEPLLEDLGELDLTGIDQVIAGGESGPNARPMHPDWVRSLRDQCLAASVPYFFKQWGEWADFDHYSPCEDKRYIDGNMDQVFVDDKGAFRLRPGAPDYEANLKRRGLAMNRVGKKLAGRLLDGREWNEQPRPITNHESPITEASHAH